MLNPQDLRLIKKAVKEEVSGAEKRLNQKIGDSTKQVSVDIGNTMIVNPFGEIIAKTHHNREEVLFTQLDLNKTQWIKD